MPGPSPVILILGAGPNIGQATARFFAAKGYRVALASRSLREADSTDSQISIKSDFANPADVVRAFAQTKALLGTPSVVLYNASVAAFSPPEDPFAVPLASFTRDLTVNTTSAYVAAQQATLGFAELPAQVPKAFLYTGNVLNVTFLPRFISQGAGKSASAHMMMTAAAAYKDRGFKYYYVDERKPDGAPKYRVDGDAHAALFWELAQGKTQGPWMQTFVKDVGYKSFESHYAL